MRKSISDRAGPAHPDNECMAVTANEGGADTTIGYCLGCGASEC